VKKERVLITVKTYPQLSQKYGETVCTAGLREDGSWVRIYPVPFRRLDDQQQYSKYDWVECGLMRNTADPRPESYRFVDSIPLMRIGHLGTESNWRARRDIVLRKARVYTRLDDLLTGSKSNKMSLAVFKPQYVKGFVWKSDERQWDPAKVETIRQRCKQGELFPEDAWRETFRLVDKVPYRFLYRIEDETGKESQMQLLDWEAGALYWNCCRRTHGDEAAALHLVRQKYFDEFVQNDLHFFLGTLRTWHSVAQNPWVIVGAFPILHDHQMELDIDSS
jgi:hypothetical protein